MTRLRHREDTGRHFPADNSLEFLAFLPSATLMSRHRTAENAPAKQDRKGRKPVKFTDIGVRNLKPEGERFEVRDKDQRGLYLVVQPSGAKSWAVRYRFNGEPRKITLLGVTLAQARKLAADVWFQVAQGIDPLKARKAGE